MTLKFSQVLRWTRAYEVWVSYKLKGVVTSSLQSLPSYLNYFNCFFTNAYDLFVAARNLLKMKKLLMRSWQNLGVVLLWRRQQLAATLWCKVGLTSEWPPASQLSSTSTTEFPLMWDLLQIDIDSSRLQAPSNFPKTSSLPDFDGEKPHKLNTDRVF